MKFSVDTRIFHQQIIHQPPKQDAITSHQLVRSKNHDPAYGKLHKTSAAAMAAQIEMFQQI